MRVIMRQFANSTMTEKNSMSNTSCEPEPLFCALIIQFY
jgi:hypothetical protein